MRFRTRSRLTHVGCVVLFACANPIALAGPARPSRYVEASGLRAAFLGREDGSFEAWVYPLKVLHAFQLAFGTPAYAAERPGFGWFFGGDAFINSWAMTAYGDFQTVRRSLEFLRARQRADGKMPHEIAPGAAYIRWFEEFPYAYYHADTTPLCITAVRDYVRASGDAAFAKESWPSVRKAYDYCAAADEDGDGLMDNTKAGVAAVE